MKAYLPLAVLMLSVLLFFGCSRERATVAGSYAAESDTGTIELLLKPDGQGVWSSENDEISFKWSRRDGEVWLHTKDGGVLVGLIDGDRLDIGMPGNGRIIFTRIQD